MYQEDKNKDYVLQEQLLMTPVMILDEATSSIDTRTVKIVQDSMDKLI